MRATNPGHNSSSPNHLRYGHKFGRQVFWFFFPVAIPLSSREASSLRTYVRTYVYLHSQVSCVLCTVDTLTH